LPSPDTILRSEKEPSSSELIISHALAISARWKVNDLWTDGMRSSMSSTVLLELVIDGPANSVEEL